MVKGIIKLILVAATIMFFAVPLHGYFKTGSVLFIEKEKECGTIIKKQEPNHIDFHKYSGDLEVIQVFIIDYGDRVEKVEPTVNDYYRHKVGDRICYNNIVGENNIMAIISMISMVVLAALTVWIIAGIMSELYNYIFKE